MRQPQSSMLSSTPQLQASKELFPESLKSLKDTFDEKAGKFLLVQLQLQ